MPEYLMYNTIKMASFQNGIPVYVITTENSQDPSNYYESDKYNMQQWQDYRKI